MTVARMKKGGTGFSLGRYFFIFFFAFIALFLVLFFREWSISGHFRSELIKRVSAENTMQDFRLIQTLHNQFVERQKLLREFQKTLSERFLHSFEKKSFLSWVQKMEDRGVQFETYLYDASKKPLFVREETGSAHRVKIDKILPLLSSAQDEVVMMSGEPPEYQTTIISTKAKEDHYFLIIRINFLKSYLSVMQNFSGRYQKLLFLLGSSTSSGDSILFSNRREMIGQKIIFDLKRQKPVFHDLGFLIPGYAMKLALLSDLKKGEPPLLPFHLREWRIEIWIVFVAFFLIFTLLFAGLLNILGSAGVMIPETGTRVSRVEDLSQNELRQFFLESVRKSGRKLSLKTVLFQPSARFKPSATREEYLKLLHEVTQGMFAILFPRRVEVRMQYLDDIFSEHSMQVFHLQFRLSKCRNLPVEEVRSFLADLKDFFNYFRIEYRVNRAEKGCFFLTLETRGSFSVR